MKLLKQIANWLPALIWMGVIFLMSAESGEVSGEQSSRVLHLILSFLSMLMGQEAASALPADTLHLLLRKAAHMAEYAILFLLYAQALRKSGARRPALAALALSACYAAMDEGHQLLVPGRGPSLLDVIIDTLGAGLALVLRSTLQRLRKRRKA